LQLLFPQPGTDESQQGNPSSLAGLEIGQVIAHYYGTGKIDVQSLGGLKDQAWQRFSAQAAIFRLVRANKDAVDAPASFYDLLFDALVDFNSDLFVQQPSADRRLVGDDGNFNVPHFQLCQYSQNLRIKDDIRPGAYITRAVLDEDAIAIQKNPGEHDLDYNPGNLDPFLSFDDARLIIAGASTGEHPMSESETIPSVNQQRHWRFDWILPTLFRSRKTFPQIVARSSSNWQVPVLLLLVAALLEVFASGSIRRAAAAAGEVQLPPGFEYYSPEQQAQFMQASSATSSPAFLYVLPGLGAIGKVLLMWLLVGGILHLVLTLLGGRGDTGAVMNLVAWASLPFVIRSLVRAISIFSTKQLIASPGLSGLVTADSGSWSLFNIAWLSLVDIYMIWYVTLLLIGVRAGTGLSWLKVIGGVLFTVLLVLLSQALIKFGMSKLSDLTIVRPFLF
jgi:hypothetical protein